MKIAMCMVVALGAACSPNGLLDERRLPDASVGSDSNNNPPDGPVTAVSCGNGSATAMFISMSSTSRTLSPA